ncbi:MAG: hypothetical protein M0D55_07720 [Elusimicrobiota bacterium]|nr:MAG: hypothetical protein M0D55_07720 [Elusimicrobiota bacterium]
MPLDPPARFLVIDDEKGLRDMLSYALRRQKCEAVAAAGGEEESPPRSPGTSTRSSATS